MSGETNGKRIDRDDFLSGWTAIPQKVRAASPVVHCITNYVTAPWCADAVLAAGAAPIMADEPDEMAEIASLAGALVLNIGTLRHSRLTAMRLAADEVTRRLAARRPPAILVDGLPVATLPNSTNVIKGDAKSLFIAAASILAKTARDADCLRLETLYPGYGFAQHKGYPTPAHLAALDRLGPCPEHRRSFGPVAQLSLFAAATSKEER